MPATLYINGLQTCQLPADAQISSKIKINNPLETSSERYSWKKTKTKQQTKKPQGNPRRQCRTPSCAHVRSGSFSPGDWRRVINGSPHRERRENVESMGKKKVFI